MSNILILGASYGSLLATKLALAGHRVCLVCTPGTAELINREGTIVRFPVKGRAAPVEVRSADLPGSITAAAPHEVQPQGFDLAVLAMQEAQYAEPRVRQLMQRVARARVPCLAIMNMPPLAYLRRIESLDLARLQHCYRDAALWDNAVPVASPSCQSVRVA